LRESISQLRERFLLRRRAVPEELLEALDYDPRDGARELSRQIRLRRYKNRAEGQRLRNLLRYESELWERGITVIAGVDEAGMAPLAGPVGGRAGMLTMGDKLRGLGDSKKSVDRKKRGALR